jgi:cytochrome c oxidase subunit 3
MIDPKIKNKALKQMLWVSMISMTMMFAGLTSAYVVSKNREDWVRFELPTAFYYSTLLIILSSITFFLVLGLGFVYFQFHGFQQLIDAGLYFTGEQSNVSSSFLYVIAITHLLHIMAGIIVVIRVLFKNIMGKYSATNYFGLNMGAIFWHFVDALWVYLFLFFYFIG